MSNSDNPRIGAEFQSQVLRWFADNYKMRFDLETEIDIGSALLDPSEYKKHKFDVVSEDQSVIVECKRYTWTQSWNVPSAKIGFCNEAAFYLSLVQRSHRKFIVMLRSYNPKRNETLAEYYYRTNKHLLGDVVIAEYDPATNDMRFINEKEITSIWKARVNKFANKYLKLYENPDTERQEVSATFADECFALGLRMDCEDSFIAEYGMEAARDTSAFKRISNEIIDTDILASEIFSRWRYITHWSNYESLFDDDNREWFIEAFSRLRTITDLQ